jgi:uncharacterized protein (TIGR03437 family)
MWMRKSRTFPLQRPIARLLLLNLAVVVSTRPVGAQIQNQIFGAGYAPPWTNVAPGQILNLTVSPSLNVPDAVADSTPLPTTLSGVSVLVRAPAAQALGSFPPLLPILRVYKSNIQQLSDGTPCSKVSDSPICSNTQITVQIPTEGVCEPSITEPHGSCTFNEAPALLLLNVRASGVTGPDFPLKMSTDPSAPHLLDSCDAIFGPPANPCQPLVVHADGTSVTDGSPARVGETIVIYAVGFAFCSEAASVGSGRPPNVTVAYPPRCGSVVFSYLASGNPLASFVPGTSTVSQTLAVPDWFGLLAGYVGLYQINVKVPPMPDKVYQCGRTYPGQNGNTQVTLPPDGANPLYICVQP